MKLGPQHYPIHQWKLAGKEKRGEKKKDMLGKEMQAKFSVDTFNAFLPRTLTGWSTEDGILRGAGSVDTTTAHGDICSGMCSSGKEWTACWHALFTWHISNLAAHLTKSPKCTFASSCRHENMS